MDSASDTTWQRGQDPEMVVLSVLRRTPRKKKPDIYLVRVEEGTLRRGDVFELGEKRDVVTDIFLPGDGQTMLQATMGTTVMLTLFSDVLPYQELSEADRLQDTVDAGGANGRRGPRRMARPRAGTAAAAIAYA